MARWAWFFRHESPQHFIHTVSELYNWSKMFTFDRTTGFYDTSIGSLLLYKLMFLVSSSVLENPYCHFLCIYCNVTVAVTVKLCYNELAYNVCLVITYVSWSRHFFYTKCVSTYLDICALHYYEPIFWPKTFNGPRLVCTFACRIHSWFQLISCRHMSPGVETEVLITTNCC